MCFEIYSSAVFKFKSLAQRTLVRFRRDFSFALQRNKFLVSTERSDSHEVKYRLNIMCRLLFIFVLTAGSLPAMAAGGGLEAAGSQHSTQQSVIIASDGSRHEMIRSHSANQQPVALAAAGFGFESVGSQHARQQQTFLSSGGSRIEQKLKTLAAEKVKAECRSCQIAVECKWVSPLVAGASPGTVSGLYFDKPGMPAGYATAQVAFDDDMPSANATVQFYISVRRKVPVAMANIERGAVVGEADFEWKWKDVSRLNRQPIATADYFENKTAVRMIRRGHVFYPPDLLGTDSIRPGDRVTMQYGGDGRGVQLQIACIAREAKGVGQKVRLYSKETGRRYLAKIISKNEIIWVKTL